MSEEIEKLKALLIHAIVHSGYRRCGYDQMTSEQKALFDHIEATMNDEPQAALPAPVADEAAVERVIEFNAAWKQWLSHAENKRFWIGFRSTRVEKAVAALAAIKGPRR